MALVSVIIITRNEENNIRRCIKSVQWADEIIVVDAESEDNTVPIARQYTEKVFVCEWKGFAFAKNFGADQARGEWLLWLDADEEITPDLAGEIQSTLTSPRVDGYFIPRCANFLGKWIYHSGWYPGYVLRLIRKELAHYREKRVHEYLEPPSKVARLKHPILHYTDPSINHYFTKFNQYTSLAAEDLWESGKRFHLIDLMIRPLHITIKMYILKGGFLDGFQGFLLAIFSGMYVFVKYAKLWELQKKFT